MLYCPNCKVHISTNTKNCPLCQDELINLHNHELNETFPLPQNYQKKRYLTVKIISLLALIAIFTVSLINLLTWQGQLWSIIVIVNILYIWLVGILSFKKQINLGLKLFLHAFSILLMLVITDLFTTIDLNLSWAITYGIPIVTMTFIVLKVLFMFIVKRYRHDLWLYLIILCAIAFIPLVGFLIGLVDQYILSIISASLSYLTILGLVIFANRIIKNEFIKKFHI